MHGSYKPNFITNIFYYFLHMLIQYIWTKYILLSILSGLLLLYGMYEFFFFMSYKLHIYDFFFKFVIVEKWPS